MPNSLIVGENDLASQRPDIANFWDSNKNTANLQEVHVGSGKRFHFKCPLGHKWNALLASMCRRINDFCPFCGNRKVWSGYNDLAFKRPELVDEWDYEKNEIDPENILFLSNKTVHWVCYLGHAWEDTIHHRTTEGRNCPYCSSHRVWYGFNDLETLNPPLAAEWHPTKNGKLTPADVTAFSNQSVWWLCENKHERKTRVGARGQGRKCKKCSDKKRSYTEDIFIRSIQKEVGLNNKVATRKIITPYELDLYFPEKNMAIEFNGEHWNSEQKFPAMKRNHSNKKEMCDKLGIDLIIVWEELWHKNPKKVLHDVRSFLLYGKEISYDYTYEKRRHDKRSYKEITYSAVYYRFSSNSYRDFLKEQNIEDLRLK